MSQNSTGWGWGETQSISLRDREGSADTWDGQEKNTNHEESTRIDHEKIIRAKDLKLHRRLIWRAERQTW